MLNRTQFKKDAKGTYDPQVGAAADASAATAAKSEQFSEDYYNKYITPLLQTQSDLAKQANDREDKLYNANMADMQLSDQRYQQYGIPAEDNYYKMVQNYSAPQYQEQQAQAALGDNKVAQASAQGDMTRRMQSMGIDPSSPAAISALSDMAVSNAAANATAQTRARTAAQQLGMSLTSDAANFGRGGSSAVLNFGNAAQGNTAAGAAITGSALQGANSGASVVQTGYGLGLKGYGQNLDAYTSMNNASMQAQGQASAGLGQFLGAVGGAAISHYSDRRLKTNVTKLYNSASGYGVYEFNYRWELPGTPTHIGVMADEVERVIPSAVSVDGDGYKRVDYSKVIL